MYEAGEVMVLVCRYGEVEDVGRDRLLFRWSGRIFEQGVLIGWFLGPTRCNEIM